MYIVAPDVSPRLLNIKDLYELRSMIFKVNIINNKDSQLNDYKRICQVAQNFEGELLDWYILFHDQNANTLETITFDTFLEELKKFVSSKPIMHQLYANYYDVHQTGSVEEYNAEFYKIIFFLSREYFTEISLISRYINGLKKEIRDSIISLKEHPILLGEVMSLAKTHETIVQDQNYQSFIVDTKVYEEYNDKTHNKEKILIKKRSTTNDLRKKSRRFQKDNFEIGNKKADKSSKFLNTPLVDHISWPETNNISTPKLRRSKRKGVIDKLHTDQYSNRARFGPGLESNKNTGYRIQNGNQYRTRKISTDIAEEEMPLSNLLKIKTEDNDALFHVSNDPMAQSSTQPISDSSGNLSDKGSLIDTGNKIKRENDFFKDGQGDQTDTVFTRKKLSKNSKKLGHLSKLTNLEKIKLKEQGVCLRCQKGKHTISKCPLSSSRRNASH